MHSGVLAKVWAAGLALLAMALSCPAHAAYVLNAVESGGNVIFTGSGSVNLNALSYNGSFTSSVAIAPGSGVLHPGGHVTNFTGIAGPFNIGNGVQASTTTLAASAPLIGLDNFYTSFDTLLVPFGYTSGSVLAPAQLTFTATTLANMGLATGTYSWTWGFMATSDSYTLNITAASGVPEASNWAMMILGLGLAGASLRRNRANAGLCHQFA